jgi:hypothetical protein
MPKGPNGERRPADGIGCAISVARIATGEDKDIKVSPNKRNKGGEARAKKLTPESRRAIAKVASLARWSDDQGKGNGMEKTLTNSSATSDEKLVLAYPGNQLKEQVRDLSDTQTAFSVVKGAFFSK